MPSDRCRIPRRTSSRASSGARSGCSRSGRCSAASRSGRRSRSARCWPPRSRATRRSRDSPPPFITLGAAALAVPLAAFARRRGRRISLASGMLLALAGVVVVVLAAAVVSFPLLLVAFALIGAGQAANLQTRFAAADLATDASRGRDLSIVVWATTIGAVLGPNLVGPGRGPRSGDRDAAADRPVRLHGRRAAGGDRRCTSSGCVPTRCCSRSASREHAAQRARPRSRSPTGRSSRATRSSRSPPRTA